MNKNKNKSLMISIINKIKEKFSNFYKFNKKLSPDI